MNAPNARASSRTSRKSLRTFTPPGALRIPATSPLKSAGGRGVCVWPCGMRPFTDTRVIFAERGYSESDRTVSTAVRPLPRTTMGSSPRTAFIAKGRQGSAIKRALDPTHALPIGSDGGLWPTARTTASARSEGPRARWSIHPPPGFLTTRRTSSKTIEGSALALADVSRRVSRI